ncbi:MAG: DMT family transporter [Pseudomonadota bacterium]
MKTPSPTSAPTGEPTSYDWLLLGLIIIIGGSSFSMIRLAVETIPPAIVGVGRLWVGAGILYFLMRMKGRRFPPFLVRTQNGPRLHTAWVWMMAVGIIGNTIPFLIFPWAQQYVESGLAGVYMAFMPIWTLFLAFLFAGEALTGRKLIGFIMGFIGVLILMGPEVVSGAAGTSLLAQAAILLATFLYAVSAVISRRAPTIRPRVFSAGLLLCAAICATPALMLAEFDAYAYSWRSVLGVIGLGIFPTGLGAFLIIILIKRAGAGFMALANYLTPIWAVVLGAMAFGERLAPQVFVALSVILLGVFISQRKTKLPALETGDGTAGEIAPMAAKQ